MSWDTFADDVKNDSQSNGPGCGACIMVDKLPEDARASVLAALARNDLTTNAIHRSLVHRLGNDEVPSLFTLRRHRRGECAGGRR